MSLHATVDRIWDACWAGGVTNPLDIVDQATLLLFARQHRPDEWAHLLTLPAEEMHDRLTGLDLPVDGGTLTLPARLTATVANLINQLPIDDRDTIGDLYEYALNKLSVAGVGGQFRSPTHLARLLAALIDPQPGDIVCDPACGTAGMLTAAADHIHGTTGSAGGTYLGWDVDRLMVRLAGMNLLLRGTNATISRRNTLADLPDPDTVDVILANPPFGGTVNPADIHPDLKSYGRRTEVLFLAVCLRLLKPGGRAAVVIPDGVLFASSKPHQTLRRALVEDHQLDAVIKLPAGVFRPYAGVATSILMFRKQGQTQRVWFYDMQADGWSLDDKRTPLLPADKLGHAPTTPLADGDHERNNLPDLLARWRQRHTADGPRTGQHFHVSKKDIVGQDYDLMPNRYRQVDAPEVEYEDPLTILAELEESERRIRQSFAELRTVLTKNLRPAQPQQAVPLPGDTGRALPGAQPSLFDGWEAA